MPRKAKHYETLTCKHCGKEFTALKDKYRKYCSKECGYAGRCVNRAKIKGREEYDVDYRQSLGIFILMIDDAKDEMIRIRDKGTKANNSELLRFDSCQRWLMNQNGGLENLLSLAFPVCMSRQRCLSYTVLQQKDGGQRSGLIITRNGRRHDHDSYPLAAEC